jgi:putative ABC transport system permease protein
MPAIRHAIRALLNQPLFTAVSLATMALGIGANTAIFSLVDSLLLRPLPFPASERLVFVWNSYPLMGLPKASVSIPDYLDRRTQAAAIEEAALFNMVSFNMAEEGRPEHVVGLRATPSFFATYATWPSIGRGFDESHATPGQDRVAVLGHALWTARFGGDPAIVGRDIRLNGEPYRVLGVMPPGFLFPGQDVALIVPFAFTAEQRADTERGQEFSVMVARLRPGATIAQLDEQMRAIVRRNAERLAQARAFWETSGFTGYAVPYRDEVVGDVRPALLVLQTGVLLVLLIAGANVANLQLVRATARQREMAVRAALGASSRDLLRLLLVEGLVLAAAGGLLGVAVGAVGMQALVAMAGEQLPLAGTVALHPSVLAFSAAVSLLTGVLFGLVPAVGLSHGRLLDALKEEGGRSSPGRRTSRFRNALAAGEVAVALMLLVGAGLLARSFARLQGVDPGFQAGHVLTARLTLPETRYREASDVTAFWNRVLERIRAIPGVASAGLVRVMPFSGQNAQSSYEIVGYAPGPGEARPHAQVQWVDAGFFEALRIPLRQGRTFTPGDAAGAPQVVVIDEFLARRYFKGQDPVGRQIRRGPPGAPPWTIVGVVASIRKVSLAEPVEKETIYFPVAQAPVPDPVRTLGLVVRTHGDPQAIAPAVREAVRAVDPEQPIFDVRTMEEWIARSLARRRTPMVLTAAFGALALLLAAVGLYGVLAYTVGQRVRELGIRQVLGADRAAILKLVLGQGLLVASTGTVAGVVASFWITGLLRSQLFGVSPRDPAVLAAAPALLLLVALVACLAPAYRATRVEPIAALREG